MKETIKKEDVRSKALEMIDSINTVEGFDPTVLTEQYEYTDSNTGVVGKTNVLPARVRIAWFRLVYREGKISVTVRSEGAELGRFVAEAKVYRRYDDAPDNFLANAIVSRRQNDLNGISPREWAQTAAISKALCNAGFRLSSEIFSDELDALLHRPNADDDGEPLTVVDEDDVGSEDAAATVPETAKKRGRPKKTADPVETDSTDATETPVKTEPAAAPAPVEEEKPAEPELTADDITNEMFEWAMNLCWKTSERSKTAIFNGKPMREMLQSEDGCKILKWAAGKETLGDYHKAAKILCLKAQG